MKKLYLYIIAIIVLLPSGVMSQVNNVGIGTPTPDQSALLDLTSGKMGFLAPRMTTVQRLAIPNPANGLFVYDITVNCFFYYTTGNSISSYVPSWVSLCQTGGGNTGNPGATGATGPQGSQGVAGATGPQGAQGSPGVTGSI